MMKCPACGKDSVSFMTWGCTKASLKTKCQHCDTQLKANWVTWAGLVLTVLICLVLIFTFKAQFDVLKESMGKTSAYLLWVGVPAAIIGVIVWFIGGYKVSD